MTDATPLPATDAGALTRRDAIVLGGALAAGAVLGSQRTLGVVDDPARGVPPPVPALTGGPLPGRSRALPNRRGRRGYRPRPAYSLGKVLGSLTLPALGVSQPLLEGVDLWVLDGGPGHWPGTVLPGQVGNCVIAGHRVSGGRVFRYVDQLRTGDVVQLEALGLTHTYALNEVFIVAPTELSILNATETATATLFACHPPGSVAQRIVATFTLD